MIRQASVQDLDSIMDIYETARAFMQNTGNASQWGTAYPERELIVSDIQNGTLYVLTQKQEIHGVFMLMFEPEPCYGRIEQGAWKSDTRYGTIHRVASDGKGKGVFSRFLDYCKASCSHLRIDTHADNLIMQHLIEKGGFQRCGIVYVEDGSARIAYEYLAEAAGQDSLI